MKADYEALFSACIKLSGKWTKLSNAVVGVSLINALWDTFFILFGYPEQIAFQSLSDRLLLVSFGCIGISVILGLIVLLAMRKLESD